MSDTTIDNLDPVEREIDATGLTIRGSLPRELRGVLYRNGPNPQFRSDDHWFTGDGMLHAIVLDDRGASYRNRWIRTPKWLSEHRAGRRLYQGFRGRLPDAPEWTADDGGSANTNIVWHGGRLLALEEGHLPTEIVPVTLETNGYWDGGVLQGPFTAHPKVDPSTGELVFFGYNASGRFTPTLSYGTVDRGGRITRYDRFDGPFPSMVHDFIVSERHALFPVLPLTGSQARAEAGQAPYAWEPGKGSHVGVLARAGQVGDVRWFHGDPCYAYHVMNAREDGSRIVVDLMAYPEPPLFPHADGSANDPEKERARLTRWTFDLASTSDRYNSEVIDDRFGEFPRIDDRVAGRPNRHGWFACSITDPEGDGRRGVAYLELQSGRRQTWLLSPGDGISEPVFAPRGAGEGDGWILAVAWRADAQRSELLVFDGTAIEAGPVATVEMAQRIPFGFHGNWVAGA